jgi:hypothetical protein
MRVESKIEHPNYEAGKGASEIAFPDLPTLLPLVASPLHPSYQSPHIDPSDSVHFRAQSMISPS